MLDEHISSWNYSYYSSMISWNDHRKTVESQLGKSIGLLNRASYFLHKNCIILHFYSSCHIKEKCVEFLFFETFLLFR